MGITYNPTFVLLILDWFAYCHVTDLAEDCVTTCTHETALYREGRREDYGGKDKHAHDTHDTDLYKTGAKEVLILERAT